VGELVLAGGAALHSPGEGRMIEVNSNLTCSQSNLTVAHDVVLFEQSGSSLSSASSSSNDCAFAV
jgi:hypothetical protein